MEVEKQGLIYQENPIEVEKQGLNGEVHARQW
jgi:hypothetical protein